jgi:hypothetical protein
LSTAKATKRLRSADSPAYENTRTSFSSEVLPTAEIFGSKQVIEARAQRLNSTIPLLDESRRPVIVWKFFESWPCKWIGAAINDENSAVGIEEIVVAVERVELE